MSKLKCVYYYSKTTKARDLGPHKCHVIGPLHAEFIERNSWGVSEWNLGSHGIKIDTICGQVKNVKNIMHVLLERGWPRVLSPDLSKDELNRLGKLYHATKKELIKPVTYKGIPVSETL